MPFPCPAFSVGRGTPRHDAHTMQRGACTPNRSGRGTEYRSRCARVQWLQTTYTPHLSRSVQRCRVLWVCHNAVQPPQKKTNKICANDVPAGFSVPQRRNPDRVRCPLLRFQSTRQPGWQPAPRIVIGDHSVSGPATVSGLTGPSLGQWLGVGMQGTVTLLSPHAGGRARPCTSTCMGVLAPVHTRLRNRLDSGRLWVCMHAGT